MPPTVTSRLNRPNLPPSGGPVFSELEIEPGMQATPANRHIVICVDTSGSMSGRKLEQAKNGIEWVFGLLEPDDSIGIVSFNKSVTTELPTQAWRDINRQSAMQKVNALSTGGGTDIYNALEEAAQTFTPATQSGSGNANVARRILLLSDGQDNYKNAEEFTPLAKQIGDDGISIMAAGLGQEYDKDVIETVGTKSQGRWTHLDQAEEIQDFLGKTVEEASTVVAADPRLKLDVTPGCEVSDVYRGMPQVQPVDVDWNDNTAIIGLPDLLDQQRQKVVLKLHAPQHEVADNVTLATTTLETNAGTTTTDITVTYTEDPAKLQVSNDDVALNHRKTEIINDLGQGNVAEAETKIEDTKLIHDDAADIDELEEQATRVKEGGRAEQQETTIIQDDQQPR